MGHANNEAISKKFLSLLTITVFLFLSFSRVSIATEVEIACDDSSYAHFVKTKFNVKATSREEAAKKAGQHVAGLNKSDSKGKTGEDIYGNTHACKGCDPGESGCEMSAGVTSLMIHQLGDGLWEIAPEKHRTYISVRLDCTSCVLIECLLNSFTELEARICTEKASENPKTIMMNVPVSSTAEEQESKNSRE
ncbi:MAG: hypothetical protein HN576_13585 [Bacteriovoracaceae bacterium]|nr:hypothetical protein [Bacteriovoracaceae bacterium]